MNDTYLIPLFVAGTSLLSLFAFFLIAFLIVQKGKQNKYRAGLLQARLQEQEFTMDKISREIHDNIGQLLSVAQMNLYTMEDIAHTKEERLLVINTNELVGQAMYDLQNISHSLNGDYIKSLGLDEALKKELEYIQQSKNMACTININDDGAMIEPEKEVIIFRIAQEAIHNILKYAQATTLEIELNNSNDQFLLSLSDNGIGFDIALHTTNGTGLMNMHHRAALIGSKLKIDSAPGQGTKVTITITKK